MIEVFGVSDDLVEINGEIVEEFLYGGEGPLYLGFSDGTLLYIIYDAEGIWRINRRIAGSATYNKNECSMNGVDYSDRVTLDNRDDIKWVVCGQEYGRNIKEDL